MSHRICIELAFVAALAGLSLMAAPASNAEDQRPCVSREEYRAAPALHIAMRGTSALDRRQLEKFWDVEGLGVIDPDLTDARSTFWMYPACGYSFDEAQIWVITTGRNGAADVMSRYVARGATLHGHE